MPGPVVIHRPVVRPTYVAPRTVYVGPRYRVRPTSGVFVYGPRPVYHTTYQVQGSAEPVAVQEKHLPDRKVDRANSLAIGMKAGSYFGAYDGANAFGDVGLGLTARYRPVESFGIEVAGQRHADPERVHTTAAVSGELFAFPWSRVSPYVLAGATYTQRSVQDEIWLDGSVQTLSTQAPLLGAHAGAGLEIALGKRLAVDLEARYIHYVNPVEGDPTLPGALTTSAGAVWHF